MNLLKRPKSYPDYTFWRSEHHRYALGVMFAAAIYSISQWIF